MRAWQLLLLALAAPPTRALQFSSRRQVVQRSWGIGTAFGIAVAAPAAPAGAFPFGGGSALQSKVDALLQTKPQLDLLKKMLQVKELKGGPEDSQTVFRYSRAYFQAFPAKMSEAVAVAALDSAKQEQLAAIPDAVKGHVQELEEACKAQSAAAQLKELNDISDALDDFVTLVAGKIDVKKSKELLVGDGNTDTAAYFGPFGCEFYGLKRKVGSNQCVDDTKPASL